MRNKNNISYNSLSFKDKEFVKNSYYKYKNKKMSEIKKIIEPTLNISLRCFKKILIEDFNINTRRKNKYTLNENFFNTIDTESKAYIIGLIAADGFVGDKSNSLIIALKDKDILEEIKILLEYDGDIKPTKKGGFKNSSTGFVLNINSKQIKNDLNKIGIYSNKSLTFDKIPNIPNNLKRHFLRGYFDGDGSVSFYKRKYIIKGKTYIYDRLNMNIIATEKLLYEFVHTFGIEEYNISKSKTKDLKYINISSKNELIKMYHLLYDDSTIFLNRKRDIWVKYIKSL